MGIKSSFSELIQNLGCVSSPTFPLPSVCGVEKITRISCTNYKSYLRSAKGASHKAFLALAEFWVVWVFFNFFFFPHLDSD